MSGARSAHEMAVNSSSRNDPSFQVTRSPILGLRALACETKGRLIMRRTMFSTIGVVLSAVGVAATLSQAAQNSASSYLTRAELLASHGAGAKAKKCSYSCNAANQYVNLCPAGDLSGCTVCSKGTNDVDYTSMGGTACSTDNFWTTSPTDTQDCGLKALGLCQAIGDCANPTNGTENCTDPKSVVKQGGQ
jgi:hypothetical protein